MEKNYKKVKLSSNWTKFGYYFAIITLVGCIPFALYLIYDMITNFGMNNLVALVILMPLIGICVYVIKYIAIGYIKDNVIYLQKIGKQEKRYELQQLENVKVYESRRDKYIVVTLNNGNGSEKYLLASSKMFYATENINSDLVLQEIYEKNKNIKL